MANRLARESSPYLLQHQDNPVDWYPWGEEAFARARSEEKPIFLSIGYSTCHWCHVMEHESFENAATADALNRDFVAIKVDREERPDVDDVYMQAVQTMTGQGGWPLSVFLTPDRKPFYGGTYFPPAPRWGRPGFPQILSAIAGAWRDRREELETSAAEMLAHLEAGRGEVARAAAPLSDPIALAVRALERQFDPAHGGFGGAPKFPPSMRLELLLRRWLRTGDPQARVMTEKTLLAMAAGGMYDQVGGGFHRYSVDERWLVPHFEKMLYDNAMLARVYVLAHRAFGGETHARIARETLDYLLAEMTPPEGGFFAAQDADSGGEEGTFYVWNPKSLAEAVGEEAAPIVAARFGVTPAGNFEETGETVLSLVRSPAELASEFGRSEAEVVEILRTARRRMFEARARRIPPGTDDKLLTDWSALAISAFSLAARVLDEPRYEAAARAAADRILGTCVQDGELLHREKAGRASIPGFATDYAYLIEALLDLYEATFETRYFAEAVGLQGAFEERFSEGPDGGYFLSAAGHDGLILRPRETWDGATPSSNSVAAMNLLRLAVFTGDDGLRRRADAVIASTGGLLERAPVAVPRLLCALDFAESPPREIVLAGAPGRSDFEALRRAVFANPGLNRVVAHAETAARVTGLAALGADRSADGGPARAYVCSGFACRSPVTDPSALAASLETP
ncbi:MAG TPA: thioredoxin domain-containing protein [Thermoanaerobaculia bacterium]|nr:thioredoxin domain-containing protein [Thermoanaerobaculia bacterium]